MPSRAPSGRSPPGAAGGAPHLVGRLGEAQQPRCLDRVRRQDPPEQFTGERSAGSVGAVVDHLPAVAGLGDAVGPSQMASCHENGTYSSAMSSCRRGSVIPAWAYTSSAHCTHAAGRITSRPGKAGGSDRDDEPRIQAGGRLRRYGSLAAVLVGEHHGVHRRTTDTTRGNGSGPTSSATPSPSRSRCPRS